jgi:hypothetical protein
MITAAIATSHIRGWRCFRMFEQSPAVKETFEKFRTLDTVEDIRHSTVLFTHGLVVMSAMDEIFNNLDDK